MLYLKYYSSYTNTNTKQPDQSKNKGYSKPKYKKKFYKHSPTSWKANLSYPLLIKDKYFEAVTGKSLFNIEGKSAKKTRPYHFNTKLVEKAVTGKFISEIYPQFQFDDQLFRSRVKERYWASLMVAKRSNLDSFLLTCRNFARDLLLDRHKGIHYMLDYFYFVSLYLKNDFLCFALTKFLTAFSFSFNHFYQYEKSKHFLFLKKGISLRSSRITRKFYKKNQTHFRFFFFYNSFNFFIFRILQFFWSLFILKMPYQTIFKKPRMNEVLPLTNFSIFSEGFTSLLQHKIRNEALLPLWLQRVNFDLLLSYRETEFSRLSELLSVVDTKFESVPAWTEKLWRIFTTDFVEKPIFDFVFWEEKDEAQAPQHYEFATQIYTQRAPFFVYPLPSKMFLVDKFGFDYFHFLFLKSLPHYFGVSFENLRFSASSSFPVTVSNGFFFNVDNFSRPKSFTDLVWTGLLHVPSRVSWFSRYWKSNIFESFFGEQIVHFDYLENVRGRTAFLLTLSERTECSIINCLHSLLTPWVNLFSESWDLLHKALGNDVSQTSLVFDWWDNMDHFADGKLKNLFPLFVYENNRDKIIFPFIFPLNNAVESTVLPYKEFSGVRFRRRVSFSSDFARKYNLRFFLKYMTVLIKEGNRKRAIRIMRSSLADFKESYFCDNVKRVFTGAAMIAAPEVVTSPFKKGGKSYHIFLLARIQRLLSNGIKSLYYGTYQRQVAGWQEFNYTFARALSEEVWDVINSKFDCFTMKNIRDRTKFLTELRRFSTRRRGLTLGTDPYKRFEELRIMSSPVQLGQLNKKLLFQQSEKQLQDMFKENKKKKEKRMLLIARKHKLMALLAKKKKIKI